MKALADFLRKTVFKLTNETMVDHVSPLIDEKPEFASTKPEIRSKALELAIKESAKRENKERAKDRDNSSSYDARSHSSNQRQHRSSK